jgi:hypothetical protein
MVYRFTVWHMGAGSAFAGFAKVGTSDHASRCGDEAKS